MNEHPSPRRMAKAGLAVATIVIAVIIIIFLARNIWHSEELKDEQMTGNNVATEHTGPSYD